MELLESIDKLLLTQLLGVTDRTLKIVVYLNFLLIALTLIVLVFVVVFRVRSIIRRRQQIEFNKVWQPVLEECMYELPEMLPTLATRDLMNFLLLWNGMQENIKGEVRDNLNFVARWLKIDGRIKNRLLKRGNLSERLLAVNTAGHMRAMGLWGELEDLVMENEGQLLVMIAAKALTRMNDKRAASIIIPMIAVRREWPLPAVAGIIKEIHPESVAEAIGDVIVRVPESMVPRLTRFLRFATVKEALAIAMDLMEKYDSPDVIASCLNVIGDMDCGEHLALIRSFVAHDSWVVRLQAVCALGKIGTMDDVTVVIGLLADREWWVRHRAARSLMALPSVDTERLERILEGQTDKYAIEALKQAMVEKMIVGNVIAS